MAKWILEKRGFGKAGYLVAKSVSTSKAKTLEKDGVKTYNHREEAVEEMRSK
jgi:hypothetical protein